MFTYGFDCDFIFPLRILTSYKPRFQFNFFSDYLRAVSYKRDRISHIQQTCPGDGKQSQPGAMSRKYLWCRIGGCGTVPLSGTPRPHFRTNNKYCADDQGTKGFLQNMPEKHIIDDQASVSEGTLQSKFLLCRLACRVDTCFKRNGWTKLGKITRLQYLVCANYPSPPAWRFPIHQVVLSWLEVVFHAPNQPSQ